MLINTEKTVNPVFGWTVDDDTEFYPELIEKVKKGASIVHEFSREIDPSEEYIYLFFKSFHPSIIETAFKGKIEYVGIFPEGIAPHAYKFTPSEEVILNGLGIVGVNEEGNDWALVEVPKKFKSADDNNS